MTIGDLRKIIHEEVVKAMREELRDILVEALDTTREASESQGYLSEVYGEQKEMQRPKKQSASKLTISDILQETGRSMGKEDYRNLLGEQRVESKPPVSGNTEQLSMPGIPDFMLSAMTKAKAVLEASNTKDQERHGI